MAAPFLRCGRIRGSAIALFALLAAALAAPPGVAAQDQIMTWGGNAPDWDSKLNVSALRYGCSSAPTSCMRDASSAESANHVQQIFFSILLKPQQTLNYVTQYNALTASRPDIIEIGFDDFVSQAMKLGMDPGSLNSYLAQIIRTIKQNSRLKFGITLYENEIASQLAQLGLSGDFYSQVDFVHLYPHYRHTAEPFASYVKQAKALFPNAQIVAGVYAYDRRDYLPCAKASPDHCSNQQELILFKDMFQQELTLLRSGQVSWLEFFPGAFGQEEAWRNWDEPRICSASRRQECVDNTKAMRQIVLQLLVSH